MNDPDQSPSRHSTPSSTIRHDVIAAAVYPNSPHPDRPEAHLLSLLRDKCHVVSLMLWSTRPIMVTSSRFCIGYNKAEEIQQLKKRDAFAPCPRRQLSTDNSFGGQDPITFDDKMIEGGTKWRGKEEKKWFKIGAFEKKTPPIPWFCHLFQIPVFLFVLVDLVKKTDIEGCHGKPKNSCFIDIHPTIGWPDNSIPTGHQVVTGGTIEATQRLMPRKAGAVGKLANLHGCLDWKRVSNIESPIPARAIVRVVEYVNWFSSDSLVSASTARYPAIEEEHFHCIPVGLVYVSMNSDH